MKNRDLEKSKERAISDLRDYQSTTEYIIEELVDEIETLESSLDDAETTILELNEQIENLNKQINEKS